MDSIEKRLNDSLIFFEMRVVSVLVFECLAFLNNCQQSLNDQMFVGLTKDWFEHFDR